MQDILHSLESTAVGTMVRESLYGFPILVGIHLMALTLSIGTFIWFDLRLMGLAFPSARVTRVYRQVIPWASAGFLVMFGSGALLFTGYASTAVANPYFRIKALAIVLAGVNAVVYHTLTERGVAAWDTDLKPPRAARTAGAISLALWMTVAFCGRMMAYTMY